MSSYTVALTLPTFHVSVVFGFSSATEAAVVQACVSGRISGARLPSIEWTNEPHGAESPAVFLSVEERGDDLLVQFSGAIQTPPYSVDKAGFHWDFSKIFTALALPRIVHMNIVPFHAATVASNAGVTLLPGVSGAGKSSVAFAAFHQGFGVAASELSFIHDGEFIAGNAKMTIDSRALQRYGTGMPHAATEVDGRVVMRTLSPCEPLSVTRVLFPRVCDAPLAVRVISARRARMLLYENAVTQLPVGQLVAHETCPLGISPTRQELEIIAQQVERISRLNPVIVEGSPADIVAFLSSPTAGSST